MFRQPPAATRPFRLSRRHLAALALVWLAAALYLGLRAHRDWIPRDEGFLAHSAERVLEGELPHRDFDEVYTGGLGYLHAAAFVLFGVKLTSLRLALLLAALAWIPALYLLAARAAPPLGAAVVTAAAIAWSVPLYFAALPSWYNLFLATFGTLALVRHLESGRRRWLFVAGLCGGLSFLVKSIGLFFLAAGGLFLLYREQTLSVETATTERRSRGFSVLASALALAVAGLVAGLVAQQPSPMNLLHFALPAACLAAVVVAGEGRARGDFEERWGRLRGLLGPFVAGAALPVVVFLAPYVASSSLDDFLYGVFLLPAERLSGFGFPLPRPWTLVFALPAAALLVAPAAGLRVRVRPLWGALLGAAAVAVALWGDRPWVYGAVWSSLRPLLPAAVVAGCLLLVRRGGALAAGRRQGLFLLLSATALVGLVQFPAAHGIYFGYVAPLLVVAILFLVSFEERMPRGLAGGFLALYLVFALVWEHRGLPGTTGFELALAPERVPLVLARGGVTTLEPIAAVYERLVAEIERLTPAGSYVWAGPDCPEVYFLAARRNPTRTFFDVFDLDYGDPEARARRLLAALERHDVRVVVLNEHPAHSHRDFPELLAGLAARYPDEIRIRPFRLRYREEP